MRYLLALTLSLVFVHVAQASAAEYIELPPEELAQESVLPVFDKNDSVRSRNVVTTGRFDAGIFYGHSLTEPIANVSKLGLNLYYNPSEEHAFGLILLKNFTGLSTYADQLNQQFSTDFSRAPYPEYSALIDYNAKMFYGKMSVTKQAVFNLSIFGTVAAGIVKYVHKAYPALALGMGQKFYLSKNWGLRFDLRIMANNAPIPFLRGYIKQGEAVPSYNQFDERMTYSTNLDFGLSYLF